MKPNFWFSPAWSKIYFSIVYWFPWQRREFSFAHKFSEKAHRGSKGIFLSYIQTWSQLDKYFWYSEPLFTTLFLIWNLYHIGNGYVYENMAIGIDFDGSESLQGDKLGWRNLGDHLSKWPSVRKWRHLVLTGRNDAAIFVYIDNHKLFHFFHGTRPGA